MEGAAANRRLGLCRRAQYGSSVTLARVFRSEQQLLSLLTQGLEQTFNSLNVRLKPLGISLCKSLVDAQRFLKCLACCLRPLLLSIEMCQVVQCRRYVRQVGIRVLLC